MRRRVLDSYEKTLLGPKHSETPMSLYCLANLLQSRTEYEQYVSTLSDGLCRLQEIIPVQPRNRFYMFLIKIYP